jgi:hypothetical protein
VLQLQYARLKLRPVAPSAPDSSRPQQIEYPDGGQAQVAESTYTTGKLTAA